VSDECCCRLINSAADQYSLVGMGAYVCIFNLHMRKAHIAANVNQPVGKQPEHTVFWQLKSLDVRGLWR
jgi:hypothetical protein